MGYNDPDNRTVRVLIGKQADRVPIFEHVVNGRFIKYAVGADVQTSLRMEPKDHLKLAEFMHMDLLTLGYVARQKGIDTREKFKAMRLPSHEEFLSRVDEYLKVIEGSGRELNVYVHGPFDSTYLTMGYEQFFYTLYDDPGFVEEMMDFYTEDAVLIVNKLLERDLATVQIVDDIAYKNGPFIDPDTLKSLWYKRMQKIVEPIHAAGVPCFFHSDGDVQYFIRMLIDLGIHGINPIEPGCNDITEIKKVYGQDITLMGNVEIGGILANGTPGEVGKEVKRLLQSMMPGGRYIAMSSSSITDFVVPENYKAMIETVLEYGRY